MSDEDPLDDLSDEDLGQLVRETPAFRAAAACSKFANEAQELRENDQFAFERLVRDTHARQSSSVSKFETTEQIVDTFLDVVERHAQMADRPEDVAIEAAQEAIQDGERL